MEHQALTKEFIRSWYEWQHAPVPVSNFRLRRTSAPTYDIECALDHLASSVYSLGSGVIGRARWDPAELASRLILELDGIDSELESCTISEASKHTFREYMSITRTLLQELVTSSSERA